MNGSSVIEVVVALFLISLSIALTGVFFARVMDQSQRMMKLKAWYQLNEYCHKTQLNQNTDSEVMETDLLVLTRESVLLDEEKGLWETNLIVKDKRDKVLATRRLLWEMLGENSLE